MCFMFGANKEQVRRVLGLVEEAEHEPASGSALVEGLGAGVEGGDLGAVLLDPLLTAGGGTAAAGTAHAFAAAEDVLEPALLDPGLELVDGGASSEPEKPPMPITTSSEPRMNGDAA